METIAENRTVITRKYFFEAMAAVDNYRSSALNGMATLGGAWVILLVFTLLQHGSLIMAFSELGILTVIGIWLVFLYPRGKYKKAYRVMKFENDGNMERRVRFYDATCIIDTAGKTITLPYSDIAKVTVTRHLLVMTLNDKTGTFVCLDGFTKGNAEMIKEHISGYLKEAN